MLKLCLISLLSVKIQIPVFRKKSRCAFCVRVVAVGKKNKEKF